MPKTPSTKKATAIPSLLEMAKKDVELRDFLLAVSKLGAREKAVELLKEKIEKLKNPML